MTVTQMERAPRCLKLVVDKHGTNRCTNEQVDGSDLCSKHLAAAVQDYRQIVSAHIFGEEAAP
jgi:hypothetical protein